MEIDLYQPKARLGRHMLFERVHAHLQKLQAEQGQDAGQAGGRHNQASCEAGRSDPVSDPLS